MTYMNESIKCDICGEPSNAFSFSNGIMRCKACLGKACQFMKRKNEKEAIMLGLNRYYARQA